MENSQLDLRIASTKDAIIMVECGAEEVDEEMMVRALRTGHEAIQDVIRIQEEMRTQLGKPKATYEPAKSHPDLDERIRARAETQVADIVATRTDHDEREAQL